MADEYLFVYGTLRQGGGSPLQTLLAECAVYVDDAHFQGKLYRIDYYPGAVASLRTADRIRGEIYLLSRPEVILPQLDEYEACAPGYPDPTEYVRCQRTLQLDSGPQVEAWIYLFNRPVEGFSEIVSGDFLQPLNHID